MANEPVEQAALVVDEQTLPAHQMADVPATSSRARVIGGVLVAVAGAVSIVMYLGPFFKYLGVSMSWEGPLGVIPGITSAGRTGILNDQATAFTVSLVVIGLMWVGLGVVAVISARKRNAIETLLLVAAVLFVLVPRVERSWELWAMRAPSVLFPAVAIPLSVCISMLLLVLATRPEVTGQAFAGLRIASVTVLALAIGYSLLTTINTIWTILGYSSPTTGSATVWLPSTVLYYSWLIGLLLISIGTKPRAMMSPIPS